MVRAPSGMVTLAIQQCDQWLRFYLLFGHQKHINFVLTVTRWLLQMQVSHPAMIKTKGGKGTASSFVVLTSIIYVGLTSPCSNQSQAREIASVDAFSMGAISPPRGEIFIKIYRREFIKMCLVEGDGKKS